MRTARTSSAWKGFRLVLCPVDFSEPSSAALRYADAVARRSRSTLTVTYANDPFLIAAAAAALHDRNIAKRSAKELQAFIDATLSSGSKRRRQVRSHVSTGQPADEILKVAAAQKADLIVVGTHGLTGADRLLMGSTTLRLLQRATVPVLAVPWSKDRPLMSELETWPRDPIVAAIELDDKSRTDVDGAARIAEWFGRSLLLLHVISELPAPHWLKADLDAHRHIRLLQAEERLEALARTVGGVRVETRVAGGRVPDEVAALAADERAQLVITSLRDRHHWFGAQRGSISYQVLTHAVTPVLACPPSWRPR